MNVARFIPVENGFRMLSREVAYYLDEEGKIVDCLSLDWRDEPVRVLHIANDPVNFTLRTGLASAWCDEGLRCQRVGGLSIAPWHEGRRG